MTRIAVSCLARATGAEFLIRRGDTVIRVYARCSARFRHGANGVASISADPRLLPAV